MGEQFKRNVPLYVSGRDVEVHMYKFEQSSKPVKTLKSPRNQFTCHTSRFTSQFS